MSETSRLLLWDRSVRILNWLDTQPNGATKREISRFIRIGNKQITEAIETLLENGSIEHCEVQVGRNSRRFYGYRIADQHTQHIG